MSMLPRWKAKQISQALNKCNSLFETDNQSWETIKLEVLDYTLHQEAINTLNKWITDIISETTVAQEGKNALKELISLLIPSEKVNSWELNAMKDLVNKIDSDDLKNANTKKSYATALSVIESLSNKFFLYQDFDLIKQMSIFLGNLRSELYTTTIQDKPGLKKDSEAVKKKLPPQELIENLADSLETFICNITINKEGDISNLKENINNLKEEKEKLKNELMIRKETKNLTEIYADSITTLQGSLVLWIAALIIVGGLAGLYVFGYDLPEQLTWELIIFSTVKMALPGWIIWFAIIQFSKSKDLLNKYIFKKNTLHFFNNMRDLHIDTPEYSILLNKNIEVMLHDPVEEINRKKIAGTPTHELADFSKTVVDLVKEIKKP